MGDLERLNIICLHWLVGAIHCFCASAVAKILSAFARPGRFLDQSSTIFYAHVHVNW